MYHPCHVKTAKCQPVLRLPCRCSQLSRPLPYPRFSMFPGGSNENTFNVCRYCAIAVCRRLQRRHASPRPTWSARPGRGTRESRANWTHWGDRRRRTNRSNGRCGTERRSWRQRAGRGPRRQGTERAAGRHGANGTARPDWRTRPAGTAKLTTYDSFWRLAWQLRGCRNCLRSIKMEGAKTPGIEVALFEMKVRFRQPKIFTHLSIFTILQ